LNIYYHSLFNDHKNFLHFCFKNKFHYISLKQMKRDDNGLFLRIAFIFWENYKTGLSCPSSISWEQNAIDVKICNCFHNDERSDKNIQTYLEYKLSYIDIELRVFRRKSIKIYHLFSIN